MKSTQLTLPINPPAESEFSESESKPLSAVAPSPAPPDEIKAIAFLWRKCIQLNNQTYFEGKGGKAKLNKQINIYCDRIEEICQQFDIHTWDAIPQAEKWIASLLSCPECGATFEGEMGCACGYTPNFEPYDPAVPLEPGTAESLELPLEPSPSAEVSFHEEPNPSAEVSFHEELSSPAEVGFHEELDSSDEVNFHEELSSRAEVGFHEEPSPSAEVGFHEELSKASGCLHQYPKKKRLKSGETKTYFYWGYYYEVRGKDGKWQSKTVSVLKEKVSQVHQLIEAGATVGDIKAFIKGYISFEEVISE